MRQCPSTAISQCRTPFGLLDYEKVFTPDLKSGVDIFNERRIDRSEGALVVVRPDQYVAPVLPLDAHDEIAEFFAGIMLEPKSLISKPARCLHGALVCGHPKRPGC